MTIEPVMTCVGALQQAGWQLAPPAGSGPPQHHILGTTGLVPAEQLPTLLADWPIPTSSPAPDEPPVE